MNATVLRLHLGHPSSNIYVRLCRCGFLVMMLVLAVGCGPVEVRVLQGSAPDAEAVAAEESSQAEGEEATAVDHWTESILVTAVAYLTVFAEICGALVIAVGLIQALVQYLRFVLGRGAEEAKDDIRLRLGRSLAVALEFGVAADILKTAVAPTWGVIAQLAAIIVLRTALNYFLSREIREVEDRREELSARHAASG